VLNDDVDPGEVEGLLAQPESTDVAAGADRFAW
jgi:hypothetical protein